MQEGIPGGVPDQLFYVPTPQGLVPVSAAALAWLLPAAAPKGALSPTYALPEALQARAYLPTPFAPQQAAVHLPWPYSSPPAPPLLAPLPAAPPIAATSPPKRMHSLTGPSPPHPPSQLHPTAQELRPSCSDSAVQSPACKRPRAVLAVPAEPRASLAALADTAAAAQPSGPASCAALARAASGPAQVANGPSRPEKAGSWSPGTKLSALHGRRATAFSAWKPASPAKGPSLAAGAQPAGQLTGKAGSSTPTIHRPKPIKATAGEPAHFLLEQLPKSGGLKRAGLGAFSRRPLGPQC